MRSFAVTVLAFLAGSFALRAQGPAPAPTGVATVGFMHAIHATNVVEKTLAFYTEVFGLSGQVQPFANEAVPILTDSPGVSLRVSMLRLVSTRSNTCSMNSAGTSNSRFSTRLNAAADTK